jgi:hypothetical protein
MLGPKSPEEIKKDKKAEEAQEKRLQKLHIAYKHLFDGANGRIVLNDLRKRCNVDVSTFVPNSDETILNEGKREVFLHIMTMAGIDILKLKKEV